jgi:hypothetical protein
MSPFEKIQNASEYAAKSAQIAVHGVMTAIASRRMERAGSIMERMDHKNALYSDLGQLALTGDRGLTPVAQGKHEPSVGHNVAVPRTLLEKITDHRIDKRAEKAMIKGTYAYRAQKAFGRDGAPKVPSTKQAVIDSSLGLVLRSRGTSISLPKAVVKNAERAVRGPDVKGSSKMRRRIDRTKNVGGVVFGNTLARDARIKSTEIQAVPVKHGNKEHRRTRRQNRRAQEKLDMALEMPVSSRWRDRRRKKAIERIKKHYHKADAHRDAQARIKASR